MFVEVIKPEYLDEVYYVCFLCLYLCKMVEYTETLKHGAIHVSQTPNGNRYQGNNTSSSFQSSLSAKSRPVRTA